MHFASESEIKKSLNSNVLMQVVGLQASTNNKASTVLAVFLSAVAEHGVPSWLRGDRGGENVALSVS